MRESALVSQNPGGSQKRCAAESLRMTRAAEFSASFRRFVVAHAAGFNG